MRIGATISFLEDPRKMVRELEDNGVDSFWMYEIFQGYEAFSRAGFLSAIAHKAKISVGVVNSYSRHPVITAMGAAFLSNLSGGRAQIVLGIGGDSWVGDILGYDQSRPLRRFKEFTTILRGLLNGKTMDSQSGNFKINNVRLDPASQHNIPIIVACEQPSMMRLAGRIGDGVYLEPACCPEGYIRWAAETARHASTAPDGFRIIANLPLKITRDHQKARDSAKPMLAFHLSFPGEGELYLEKAGFPKALASEIGEASGVRKLLRAHQDPTQVFENRMIQKGASLVPNEFVDQCIVMGTQEECLDRLAELERAGLTDIVFSFQEDYSEKIAFLKSHL